MDNALDLVRELRARTKEACINPVCQDGYHMCDPCGNCCDGCKASGKAAMHLNNLRIAYFEEVMETLTPRQDTDGSLVFQIRVQGLPAATYAPKEVACQLSMVLAETLRRIYSNPLIEARSEEPPILESIRKDAEAALL